MIRAIALALTVAAMTSAAAQSSRKTVPPEITTALKDACVVNALSRLPNIDGMRITQSSWEFYLNDRDSVLGNVLVSVEVRGHQAQYRWLCAVNADGLVILVARR